MDTLGNNALETIASDFDYKIREEAAPETPPELQKVTREESFRLLYIVGDSGSGKTCALQSLLESSEHGSNRKYRALEPFACTGAPLASAFSSKEEAITRLTMSGLSSIPVWFRSYRKASKGEQFRADIALGLQSFCIVDEFTSNLDRLTARSLSCSLRKYCERYFLKNVVLAGCQYDVIAWLQPDHVYDMNERRFLPSVAPLPAWSAAFSSLAFQHIDSNVLAVRPASKERWELYSPYHYLSHVLLDNASFWEAFVTVDTVERAVAFAAVCPMPSGTVKKAIRGHRLVVIPSAQGMGIGAVISEAVAQHYLEEGYRYFSKTSHPRLGDYRNRSAKWMPTVMNMKAVATSDTASRWERTHRKCYSHEYCGEAGREGMFARKAIQGLEDEAGPRQELEILPPLYSFAFLRPLKVYGVISLSNAGSVVARVNHNETVFLAKDYNTLQEARIAAEVFLERHSALSCVTNLYSISDDGEVASVDLSLGNKGTDFLRVDAHRLTLLSKRVWRRRNSRVFSSSSEGRIYVEEVLYPGRKICAHLNGDRMDYAESNLAFDARI